MKNILIIISEALQKFGFDFEDAEEISIDLAADDSFDPVNDPEPFVWNFCDYVSEPEDQKAQKAARECVREINAYIQKRRKRNRSFMAIPQMEVADIMDNMEFNVISGDISPV